MPDANERTPADRYAQLPQPTRDFIEELRPEEVLLLREVIRLMQAIGTVSRFVRWVIIALVGVFFATVGLIEAINKVRGWLR